MANNPELFNAIINGITSGSQNRWTIPSNGGGDFTIFRTIVTVIATEVDEAISTTELSISQISLMESICQGYFQNNSVENIRHTLPDVVQYIVNTYTAVSAILEPVPSEGEAPFIAPGDFPGQPAYWNGTQWAPLPVSEGLALDTLSAVSDTFTGFTMNGEDNFLGLATGANPSAISQANQLALANFNPADDNEYNSIVLGENDLRITERINSGSMNATEYVMAEHSHLFKSGGNYFLELKYESGVQKIGFYGATPVARPVITGASSAALMNSLVSALVALGLVTDGR